MQTPSPKLRHADERGNRMSDILPEAPRPAEIAAVTPAPVAATPSVPPGWYPDPTRPGTQRWWTGQEWSSHIAPTARTTKAAPSQTIIVHGKKPVNHAFHLIMSLLTLGLWIPVWIIVAIAS